MEYGMCHSTISFMTVAKDSFGVSLRDAQAIMFWITLAHI